MLAIFHAFNNRSNDEEDDDDEDAPLSCPACPVLARLHPSIYSFNSPAARSLAHSCAEVFIQLLVRSFIHSHSVPAGAAASWAC